jgi:hypothetical protein
MANTNKMYSIKDEKAGAWERPFTARTHGEAERIFKDLVNGNDNMIAKYPEDFSLWHIGDFNPDSGEILPQKQTHMGGAATFKNPETVN